ncbi:MAG TPA: TonB-dependent siderophore receptor [Ramlibacter sp.]
MRSSAEKETATSPVIGYRAKNAATATKTDTPLAETPQSITVVTRDQLVDQGATGLQEALNYAAGVRSDAYGLDTRADGVRIRGSFPDEYQDGLRKMADWYTSNTRTDPYQLERIEVLRGPSSMLFGQGVTGGLINMITKRPQAEAQREIGIQLGSYGRKQLQADLTGPLTEDGQLLYRLVALGRVSDTQVDYVPDDRALLAPSLTWRPSAATSLTLQGTWQKDKTGSSSQFFPWSGVRTDNPNGRLPTSRFIGDPNDHYDSERSALGWMLDHRFNDRWSVHQNVRFSRNDVDYATLYGDSFTVAGGWAADPIGQRLIGRYGTFEKTDARLGAADQNIRGEFQTGSVRHKMVAGVDLLRYRKQVHGFYDSPASGGGGVPPIDAYDPVYVPYTPGPLVRQPRSTLRQQGAYLQDQLYWGNWILVAGLRHDRATNTLERQPDEDSKATTRRLGVMYTLGNGWVPYLSYAESFTPVAGISPGTNARFKPLRGEQIEAGVKYEPEGRNLSFSAAAYELREKNQRVPGPPPVILQAGTTKVTGLELEFKGRFNASTDFVSHYNYTDVDTQIEAVPTHQGAAWVKHRFSIAGVRGFSFGAGVRYMGPQRDGSAPTMHSVALLDTLLAYENDTWRYALNVSNLTDKVYASTCLNRGDCWYGARRTVVASATYRF